MLDVSHLGLDVVVYYHCRTYMKAVRGMNAHMYVYYYRTYEKAVSGGVRACVRACMHACMRACVRACSCVSRSG